MEQRSRRKYGAVVSFIQSASLILKLPYPISCSTDVIHFLRDSLGHVSLSTGSLIGLDLITEWLSSMVFDSATLGYGMVWIWSWMVSDVVCWLGLHVLITRRVAYPNSPWMYGPGDIWCLQIDSHQRNLNFIDGLIAPVIKYLRRWMLQGWTRLEITVPVI